MAPERGQEEVAVRRIVACFAPGSAVAPAAIAELAKEMQAELLGLFIEDIELLRFAALPFAAEVGYASALPRALDPGSLERALRRQADSLRRALAAALDPTSHSWTFRVARGALAESVAAALDEGYAPSLLIPPGVHPRGTRLIVRRADLGPTELRAIMAAARPVLILPA